MNIYTYYDIFLKDQDNLIDVWQKSWRKYGWNPIIISKNDSNATDQQLEYLTNLPSINPKEYEMACFLRWNAMSNMGGWMSDYDVVNCGFTPEDSLVYESMSVLERYVPCLVYSSKEDYDKFFNIICDRGLDYVVNIDSRQHISDMRIMAQLIKTESFIKSYRFVKAFQQDNSAAKVVHCSFSACYEQQKTKIDAMLSLFKS